jgi:hypothetical protein
MSKMFKGLSKVKHRQIAKKVHQMKKSLKLSPQTKSKQKRLTVTVMVMI